MGEPRQRNDWFAVAAYAVLAATSQMLWLTYAPITTESAAHFGVSEDAVGWLAELFPLLYVLLAVPAALLLDRWLRQMLIGASLLMLAGASLRLAIGGFSAALAGQLLVAAAQPVVLAAVTKLAAERVAPEQRATAISVGSAGLFLGIVLALVLGAVVGARDQLQPLLTINLVVALLAAALTLIALRRPSEREADESVAIGVSDLRAIYTDPVLSRLGAMVFLGMGIFNAVATWLEVLLRPEGIGSSQTSWILVAMTVAGVISAVLLPPRLAQRHVQRGYLQLAALVGAVGFLLVSALSTAFGFGVAFAVVGFFLLAAQPVILEISERRAGHAAASAAGAILLAGNLGGIVLAVLVQTINGHATAAFVVLAVAMLLIAPLARSLPDDFNTPIGD
jgi:predicted MFS family arabinose efflux permease